MGRETWSGPSGGPQRGLVRMPRGLSSPTLICSSHSFGQFIFTEHLLHYVAGIALGAGETAVTETGEVCALWS